MKIYFNNDDLDLAFSALNKNSMLSAVNADPKSAEKWGLPIFKRLVFKKYADMWKDARVKKALNKVKEYAKKHNYTFATAQEAKNNKSTLWSWMTGRTGMVKGLTATYNEPNITVADGVALFTVRCSFKRAMGFAVATLSPLAIAITALATRGNAMFDSYVLFKKSDDKLKIVKFGYFLVGDLKEEKVLETKKVSTESKRSVEAYELPFSKEDCEECEDGDTTVVVVDTDEPQDLSEAEDAPPTTEVILDSSDADGSITPAKDADEAPIEVPTEKEMDEETAESFEALTRKDEEFDMFNFM